MYNSVDDILDSIKSGSLKVAKLSKETGIPASRMYKWKDRGSKITAQDSGILKKWMEKLDNSPRETFYEREPVNEKEAGSELMQAIIQLTKTQNMILDRQEKDMIERIKNIETSLTQLSPVLAGVYSLSLQIDSGRETVLKSLARLEGKKEDHLLREADKILVNKMHRQKLPGKLAGADKNRKD